MVPAPSEREPRDAERLPDYRGETLDADRGPGLGCFWFQIALLAVLLVATPLTVVMTLDPAISATLLIVTLVLLLFVGQTTIFLLRLVAADRRTRRRPLNSGARPTVGQLEDKAAAGAESAEPADAQAKPESSAPARRDED